MADMSGVLAFLFGCGFMLCLLKFGGMPEVRTFGLSKNQLEKLAPPWKGILVLCRDCVPFNLCVGSGKKKGDWEMVIGAEKTGISCVSGSGSDVGMNTGLISVGYP